MVGAAVTVTTAVTTAVAVAILTVNSLRVTWYNAFKPFQTAESTLETFTKENKTNESAETLKAQ